MTLQRVRLTWESTVMIRLRSIGVSMWLILPLVVALADSVWIDQTTTHFQALTGRAFYGLAGYHDSFPERSFAYHPGGHEIRLWTTIIPGYTTGVALLLSAILAIVGNRKRGWPTIVAIVIGHVIVAGGFVLVDAYYDINITGVFI